MGSPFQHATQGFGNSCNPSDDMINVFLYNSWDSVTVWIHCTLTHIHRHPGSSNFTAGDDHVSCFGEKFHYISAVIIHFTTRPLTNPDNPQLQIIKLDITSSQSDRSGECQTSKLAMVMWANLVRISFHFSCNHTLHCKPSNESRQPRDADADHIGWNYQLAVWWGTQKLKRFANSRCSEIGKQQHRSRYRVSASRFVIQQSSCFRSNWLKWIGLVMHQLGYFNS